MSPCETLEELTSVYSVSFQIKGQVILTDGVRLCQLQRTVYF